MPTLVIGRDAPAEWQEKVRAVDPNLAVVWNPHHRDGPGWAIMRWHGRRETVEGGIPLIRGAKALPTDSPTQMAVALRTGWSFVRNLRTFEDAPRDLTDLDIRWLRENDLVERFGYDGDKAAAAEKIAQEDVAAQKAQDDFLAVQMDEALKDSLADEKSERSDKVIFTP